MKSHKPRKRFGQNFLSDKSIIQRIVFAIAPQKNDHMVEIGPGLGAITGPILEAAGHLDAIELDRDLIPRLKSSYGWLGDLTIHQADALKFDFTELAEDGRKLRIIGNLPYNISTQLMFHLLSQAHVIQDMHFMLQKEVVDRLSAQVGTSDYGRLSIMVQYYCQVESLFIVPPSAFTPQPKVQSAIVRLNPHADLPYHANNFEKFALIVREAFNQRRKTIRNSLHQFITEQQLQAINIDPNLRAERLRIEDFVTISNSL